MELLIEIRNLLTKQGGSGVARHDAGIADDAVPADAARERLTPTEESPSRTADSPGRG